MLLGTETNTTFLFVIVILVEITMLYCGPLYYNSVPFINTHTSSRNLLRLADYFQLPPIDKNISIRLIHK